MLMLLRLLDDQGVEDAAYLLLYQVHDVTIGELGREADIVTHDGEDATAEELSSTLVRENRFETALCKQRAPEWEILKHIQYTRDADGLGIRNIHILLREAERIVVLLVNLITAGRAALALRVENALALVARKTQIAVRELEADDLAVIRTSGAHDGVRLNVLESGESSLGVKRGGLSLNLLLFNGVEGRAVGTHEFRGIGCPDLFAREDFKGAENGLILESATLRHNGITKAVEVLHLENLEEAVLNDRYSETSGNITRVSVLPQSLLDLRVHEDRAAGAEVARAAGTASHLGKVTELDVHHARKALKERAATRRAALIELNVGDSTIADEDGLDVLSTDVENERYGWIDIMRGTEMRHSLDNTVVEIKCSLDKILAIAGHGRATESDSGVTISHQLHESAESLLNLSQWIAIVV